MRPLNLKLITPLLVLIAGPFFGCGQTQAGMLCAETLPRSADSRAFDPASPDVAWWQEQDEASSGPSISRAPESAADGGADKTAHGLDAALSSLFMDLPGRIDSTHAKAHRVQLGFPESRTTTPPEDRASPFLSGTRMNVPNPHLSRLFRPPR